MADERNGKTEVPCRSSETRQPIKIDTNNLASMAQKGAAYVEMLAASSGHDIRRFMPGVRVGADADIALTSVSVTPRKPQQPKPTVREMFARGEIAFDVENSVRVVVLKCKGFTPKGRPIYRVSDKNGNKWLQEEKNLKKPSR